MFFLADTRYTNIECDEITEAINREAPGWLRAVNVKVVSFVELNLFKV
jgi:predicted metal-dependent hydrolase